MPPLNRSKSPHAQGHRIMNLGDNLKENISAANHQVSGVQFQSNKAARYKELHGHRYSIQSQLYLNQLQSEPPIENNVDS